MIVEVVEYEYLPCFFEVGFFFLGHLGVFWGLIVVAKTKVENIGDFKKG